MFSKLEGKIGGPGEKCTRPRGEHINSKYTGVGIEPTTSCIPGELVHISQPRKPRQGNHLNPDGFWPQICRFFAVVPYRSPTRVLSQARRAGGGGLPQECLVPAEVPSTWNETLDVENDARYDSQHIGELYIEAIWNKKYVISNQCQVCTFKRNINWRCS